MPKISSVLPLLKVTLLRLARGVPMFTFNEPEAPIVSDLTVWENTVAVRSSVPVPLVPTDTPE